MKDRRSSTRPGRGIARFRPRLVDALHGYKRRQLPTRVLVLDMHKVINVDTTGLEILETLHRKLEHNGKTLLIAAVNDQPRSLFDRSGVSERLGPECLTVDLADALARAPALAAR